MYRIFIDDRIGYISDIMFFLTADDPEIYDLADCIKLILAKEMPNLLEDLEIFESSSFIEIYYDKTLENLGKMVQLLDFLFNLSGQQFNNQDDVSESSNSILKSLRNTNSNRRIGLYMDSRIINDSNYISLIYDLDEFGWWDEDPLKAANLIIKEIKKKLNEDFPSLLQDLKLEYIEEPWTICLMYPNRPENSQKIQLLDAYIGKTDSIVEFFGC